VSFQESLGKWFSQRREKKGEKKKKQIIVKQQSSTSNPVYVRRVDSSALVFSLSSHRHSYISLVSSSRFI
jgi:hypothetical protein